MRSDLRASESFAGTLKQRLEETGKDLINFKNIGKVGKFRKIKILFK